MKKIHGPAKRKFKLGKTLRHYLFFHPQGKKKGPKTFYSEESADKWASEHSINNYTLKKVCSICKSECITPKPAKFSLEDKFGEYRRVYKQKAI